MVDSLIPSSATQALVLAVDTHEQALATLDDTSKRKAKWPAQSAPAKKGKRWGLSDDKPFKPLPYVDLPVGLSEDEVDQFLREQRLEDLHRKIQLHQLEDVDPDIRTASPPPVYDRAGNRLNTRDIRIRKAMVAEYNRLIRYMLKAIEGYVPPPDWRPQRLVKKIIIPFERYPQAPFMGVIIGARGVNHKRLQESTGCKIFIRGRGVGDKFQTDEELQMPQHIHIEADTEEQITTAEDVIRPLLNPESSEFEYARTHGMQQLATVNGFTLSNKENRCGICSAFGHLGHECPEVGGDNFKMANVVCSICGDKGHVASDCKIAAEKHQTEHVDWKVQAEKKQSMDEEYKKMMEELGIAENGEVKSSSAMAAGAAAARALAQPATPKPTGRPQTAPPRPQTVSGTAPLTIACRSAPTIGQPQQAVVTRGVVPFVALGSTTTQPRPRTPQVGITMPPRAGLGYTGAPRHPPVVRAQASQPLVPRLPMTQWTPRQPAAFARAPTPSPSAPRRPGIPVMHARPPSCGAAASTLPSARDTGLLCPPELAGLLQSGELQEISQDCGSPVLLSVPRADGHRRILVAGPAEVMGRARLHIQAWLDVNSRKPLGTTAAPLASLPFPGLTANSSGSSLPLLPEGFVHGTGFPPGMQQTTLSPPCVRGGEALPAGFPPFDFPPGVTPPPAVPPPTGFPPGMTFPMEVADARTACGVTGYHDLAPQPVVGWQAPPTAVVSLGPPEGLCAAVVNDDPDL
eukprot:TRINITY_DN23565_c0_g1_i1.p1 TRINITY_DN23565_c0_g1~~TRINITY_DN23565_c0_g1_i1.p1  ORF type:complete len:744 (+),score=127.58 TRINITY_DN23565_c0_g1_i1:188-2419(+)